MPRSAGNSSLFERLGNDESRPRSIAHDAQISDRIEAIKANLERILNTRQGCSQSSPDEGLTDFNDAALGSRDLTRKICEDIRRAITQGEPRTSLKDIRFLPDPYDPTALNFRIDCLVPVKNRREIIEIDLVMNAGQFKIK